MDELIYKEQALNCFHDWIDKYGDVHTPDEIAAYRAIEALPSAYSDEEIQKMQDMEQVQLETAFKIGLEEGNRDTAPSVQPEQHHDEWCTDCKEYDKDRHCCPRFNKVIRKAIWDANRWISCDERLPKKNDQYIVTIMIRQDACCAEEYHVDVADYENGAFEPLNVWFGDVVRVTAWMPLPEPYDRKE